MYRPTFNWLFAMKFNLHQFRLVSRPNLTMSIPGFQTHITRFKYNEPKLKQLVQIKQEPTKQNLKFSQVMRTQISALMQIKQTFF